MWINYIYRFFLNFCKKMSTCTFFESLIVLCFKIVNEIYFYDFTVNHMNKLDKTRVYMYIDTRVHTSLFFENEREKEL